MDKNYLKKTLISSLKTILIIIALFISNEISAQGVSLTFTRGFLGTQGSNTNQADAIENLSTVGIASVTFRQPQSTTLFGGTQGNDLTGILDIRMLDGITKYSIPGALNWRITTGSKIEVFGFIFNTGINQVLLNNGNYAYTIDGGSTANSSSTLGLQAYASTLIYTDYLNYAGNAATNGLLDALNTELANSPQPSTITLNSANTTEGQNLVYTVTLSSATTAGNPQTYTFNKSGTATSGLDYSSVFTFSNNVVNNGDGTITVPGGVSSFSITVNTTDDNLIESTETLIFYVGSKSATANILDNDGSALDAATSQTNVSCYGGTNGSASVTASGGLTPYTYSWKNTSNIQIGTSSSITNLSAGNYSCTITDNNSTSITKNFTITQPTTSLSATISALTNVACNGTSTGSATVNATGGTAPYTYSWNTIPVQTNATATALAAGTYTATITDANNCSTTAQATITQPAASLSATISALTNVACNGTTTGTATVNATGGTAPYAYSWNTTPVQTTATATALAAGTYTATITDANNCSATAQTTITQPAASLSATISALTNVACNGTTTGSATVNVTGGTAPYTYSWNTTPVQTTTTATALAAGTYTATITDANNCSATAQTTITQPAASLSTTISEQTNVACYGTATG